MPLVFTTGKNLYLAIITLYMLEMAPPAETKVMALQRTAGSGNNDHRSGAAGLTWRKNAIALSVRPADQLSHLCQGQLFHEHEDRSNLIGEPGRSRRRLPLAPQQEVPEDGRGHLGCSAAPGLQNYWTHHQHPIQQLHEHGHLNPLANWLLWLINVVIPLNAVSAASISGKTNKQAKPIVFPHL